MTGKKRNDWLSIQTGEEAADSGGARAPPAQPCVREALWRGGGGGARAMSALMTFPSASSLRDCAAAPRNANGHVSAGKGPFTHWVGFRVYEVWVPGSPGARRTLR